MRFGGIQLPKELLITADVMNTLNGGMSKPSINLVKEEERYLVMARIPGVEPERMQIELKNDKLFLFHHIFFDNDHPEIELRTIPYLVGFVNVPFDVDVRKIRAFYKDGKLMVEMPFNEYAGGYHRRIDIEK